MNSFEANVVPILNKQYVPHPSPRFEVHEARKVPTVEPVDINGADYEKYGFDPSSVRAEYLNTRLSETGKRIKKRYSLEYSPLTQVSQQEQSFLVLVTKTGVQVKHTNCMVDSVEDRGFQVELDTTAIDAYALWPGKIMAVMGTNLGEDKDTNVDQDSHGYIRALSFFAPPPLPTFSTTHAVRLTEPVTTFLTCGPYGVSFEETKTAINNLLDYAYKQRNASVIILGGPFILNTAAETSVAEGTSIVPHKQTFDDQFKDLLHLVDEFKNNRKGHLEVVLVPSHDDQTAAAPLFPTPAFEMDNDYSFVSATNPASLKIGDDFLLTFTTADVLAAMDGHAIVRSAGNPDDKLARYKAIANEIAVGDTVYPLAVVDEKTKLPVNFKQLHGAAFPPGVRPDVLVLPSKLPPFAHRIESCLVINPGKFFDGSFAEIIVSGQVGDRFNATIPERSNVHFFCTRGSRHHAAYQRLRRVSKVEQTTAPTAATPTPTTTTTTTTTTTGVVRPLVGGDEQAVKRQRVE